MTLDECISLKWLHKDMKNPQNYSLLKLMKLKCDYLPLDYKVGLIAIESYLRISKIVIIK